MSLAHLGGWESLPGGLEEIARTDAGPPRVIEEFPSKLEFVFLHFRGSSTGKPAAMALIAALERRVDATADRVVALLAEGGSLCWDTLERMAGQMLSAQNAARFARKLLDEHGLTKRWPERAG